MCPGQQVTGSLNTGRNYLCFLANRHYQKRWGIDKDVYREDMNKNVCLSEEDR